MSKTLVVANWKMNPPSYSDAKKLFEATRAAAEKMKRASVVIAPPAVFLRDLSAHYRGKKIAFAAQNAHFASSGAHTGEISMEQARDARAEYVLIGHAERREMGETNDDTRKKTVAAIAAKLTPILCVGEKERTAGAEHFQTVREQVRIGLADIQSASVPKVVVTYEPLWTIGKDTAMSPHEMHEMAIFIKKTIVDLHGDVGHRIRILYGGSVDEKNASAILTEGAASGFLVGRASVVAAGFSALLKAIETV